MSAPAQPMWWPGSAVSGAASRQAQTDAAAARGGGDDDVPSSAGHAGTNSPRRPPGVSRLRSGASDSLPSRPKPRRSTRLLLLRGRGGMHAVIPCDATPLPLPDRRSSLHTPRRRCRGSVPTTTYSDRHELQQVRAGGGGGDRVADDGPLVSSSGRPRSRFGWAHGVQPCASWPGSKSAGPLKAATVTTTAMLTPMAMAMAMAPVTRYGRRSRRRIVSGSVSRALEIRPQCACLSF